MSAYFDVAAGMLIIDGDGWRIVPHRKVADEHKDSKYIKYFLSCYCLPTKYNIIWDFYAYESGEYIYRAHLHSLSIINMQFINVDGNIFNINDFKKITYETFTKDYACNIYFDQKYHAGIDESEIVFTRYLDHISGLPTIKFSSDHMAYMGQYIMLQNVKNVHIIPGAQFTFEQLKIDGLSDDKYFIGRIISRKINKPGARFV